jgi:hypothetical protein
MHRACVRSQVMYADVGGVGVGTRAQSWSDAGLRLVVQELTCPVTFGQIWIRSDLTCGGWTDRRVWSHVGSARCCEHLTRRWNLRSCLCSFDHDLMSGARLTSCWSSVARIWSKGHVALTHWSDIGPGVSGHHDRRVRLLRVVLSEGVQWLYFYGGYKTKHWSALGWLLSTLEPWWLMW